MRRSLTILLILLVLPCVYGQQGRISIDSKVDKSTIHIGDVITYTVTLVRVPEVTVEMPELGANLGLFEIRDYEVAEPESQDGFEVETIEYKISTFEVGEFEIPPLIFYYTISDDSTRHVLKTKKIEITIESLKPGEAGDIRDVKDPLNLQRDWRRIILWASIAFAILVLATISFYIWRKRRVGSGVLPEKVEPPRPAHEIALEKLQALQESDLLQEGKNKEYYIEVSEIIRQYIEGRYFIIAMELTTTELIDNLKVAEIENEYIESIQEFLEGCDLVKFAKYFPNDSENEKCFERAFQIVDGTKIIYNEFELEEDKKLANEPVAKPETEHEHEIEASQS